MSRLIIASLIVVCTSTLASAQVIYQDNFSRTGNLSGTSPNVVDLSGGTWSTTGTFLTTGSGVYSTNNNVSAFLPFTSSYLPSTTTGYLLLSATLSVTDPSDNGGISFGFTNNNSQALGGGSGVNWLYENAIGQMAGIPGPGVNGTGVSLVGGTYVNGTGSGSVVEQFDFSTHVETFIVNGAAEGTLTFDPTFFSAGGSTTDGHVQGIGITNYGPDSAISNFSAAYSLTPFTAPEPSICVLVLGGLGVLFLLKRSRLPESGI